MNHAQRQWTDYRATADVLTEPDPASSVEPFNHTNQMINLDRKGSGPTTRVYADMVADQFHYGHIEFLRQVSSMGDYVLVGINADDVAQVYKRRPTQTMEQRIASVLACRYVDEVIPNAPWLFDPTWIEKYDIGLVVHGDDYSDERQREMYKVPIERGIFRTVPYTKGISTTEIIRLRKQQQMGMNAVDSTVHLPA